jgi:DNA-binding MarR family transcriptional regulator
MERLPSWLLTQTASLAGRLVGDSFAKAGARGYHYRVLKALVEDGPTTQANLGRRIGVYPGDMVGVLNELQAGGYVTRTPDELDKRRYLVTITPAGSERAAELAAVAGRIQEELLEPLTAKQRAELAELLTILYEHHRQGFPPVPMT